MLYQYALDKILDLSPLIPPQYAAYRRLVTEGLLFFLEHLPPQRLIPIVAEQLQMPQGSEMAERVVRLLHHCPTLHKLGQVVARDRRLAPELRERLQRLESLPPTTPLSAVLPVIRRELGDAADRVKLSSQALAEASVAVIVPFSWHPSDSTLPQQGVFKVLKPGIEGRLQDELEVWSLLGTFLEERSAYHGLPPLNYGEILERVSGLLLNEIRLDQEQVHLNQAVAFYADCPQVLIPRCLAFSTPRMTAMERVYGGKVTDVADLSERHRLARVLTESLVAKPFWGNALSATFHADPHAGNLFRTHDGRLAILDWSLVTHLGKAQREAVIQIVLGALTLDKDRICQAIAALGGRPLDTELLRTMVTDALREIRWGGFPGFAWLLAMLDRVMTSASMQLSEDLMLFRKALLTLSGVLEDMAAPGSIDRTLIESGMAQLGREFAVRPWARIDSRAFGTHVSNADLWELWMTLPLTATRFWFGSTAG